MLKNQKECPPSHYDKIEIRAFLPSEEVAMNMVLPGDIITAETGFMSGHGTIEKDGIIYSSLVGTTVLTNKLLTVSPLRVKYKPEIGDIVIGRIEEIAGKKWKVNIHSQTEASLNLNATFLPEQRRKTEEDELNMRNLFKENDLISAEVHSIYNDGTVNLHTRNEKYGKLVNGQLVSVHSKQIKRMKYHFITLKCGVGLIMALNGNIWISNGEKSSSAAGKGLEEPKEVMREKMALIRNIIKILSYENIDITVEVLNDLYEHSMSLKMKASDLLFKEKQEFVLEPLRNKIVAKFPHEINKLIKQGTNLGFE